MDKVEFITIICLEDIEAEYVIIDKGNGEFTSMTKEYYDAQQATTLASESPAAPTA